MKTQLAAKTTLTLSRRVLPELRRRIEAEDFEGPALRRLRALNASIADTLARGVEAIEDPLYFDLEDLASLEAAWQVRAVRQATPVFGAMWAKPSNQVLKQIVTQSKFEGSTLPEWMRSYSVTTANRIQKQVNLGVFIGDSPKKIVQDIVGPSGVFQHSLRGLDATVRTAANQISTQAREITYIENDAFIEEVELVATLDTRTTLICMGYDGKRYPVDVGPRPPFHFRCRTTTVPVPKMPEGLGLREIPPGERASITGPVSESESYGDWLKRQGRDFQDEALGPERAKLFRTGALKIDQFAPNGTVLTIDDLRRKYKLTDADFEEAFGASTTMLGAPKKAVYEAGGADLLKYRKLVRAGEEPPAALVAKIVKRAQATGFTGKTIDDVEDYLHGRTPSTKPEKPVKAKKAEKPVTAKKAKKAEKAEKPLGATDPDDVASAAKALNPDAKFSRIRRGLTKDTKKAGFDAYFSFDDREIGLREDLYDALTDPKAPQAKRIEAHQVLAHELGHAASPFKPSKKSNEWDTYFEEGYVELRAREAAVTRFKLPKSDASAQSTRFTAYKDQVATLERVREYAGESELKRIFSLKTGAARVEALNSVARDAAYEKLTLAGVHPSVARRTIQEMGDDAWSHLRLGTLDVITKKTTADRALLIVSQNQAKPSEVSGPRLRGTGKTGWERKLSTTEQLELARWANGDNAADVVNAQLMGLSSKHEQRVVKTMETIFEKAPGYSGTAYRGMRLSPKEDVEYYSQLTTVGSIVSQPTHASASKLREVATLFAQGGDSGLGPGEKRILLEIKGKSALDISAGIKAHTTEFGWQEEVIIQQGTKYRVVSVDKAFQSKTRGWGLSEREKTYGVTKVTLEEIKS